MIDFRMTDDFDLEFASNGDYKSVDNIETAIPCGLFFEKREEETPQSLIISNPGVARGHFGFGELEASRLWKMQQARLSTKSLNDTRRFANEGLRFLTVDELVDSENVETTSNGNDIILNITVNKEDLEIERQFTL